MSNRRRFPRVRARGLAAHLRGPHGRTACQVENVSLGGLFVRTDRLEEVGTEIFVDMVKPGWKKQLSIAARITSRVDPIDGRLSKRMPGMGIQFLQLDEKQHERLAALLRELGAPDENAEVTLAEESTELELRALALEEEEELLHDPLDPQPQPVWQQVSMVEEAIAGALQEADLSPPGPLVLAEERRPPTPVASKPAPPAPAAVPSSDEAAKLMTQVRGMAMQLSDLQQQLGQRDLELERLREELENTRAELERALRKG